MTFFFPPRSGKSSIQKVVFHKMSPNETLFLESTNKIIKDGKISIHFLNLLKRYYTGFLEITKKVAESVNVLGTKKSCPAT